MANGRRNYRALIPLWAGIAIIGIELAGCSPKPKLQAEGAASLNNVVEGARARFPFKLFNPTARTIHIDRVESTCGCTVADLKPGQQIAPGERLPVTIHMDTIGRVGNSEQIIAVYTDGSTEPLKIPVRAKVRRELVLENEPRQIESRKGVHFEKAFIARWITPGKYEITGADSRDGHVSATVQPLKRFESYEIRVKVDTSRSKRAWSDTLVLHTTMPELPAREIRLTGSVAGSVTAEPSQWVLGRLSPEAGEHLVMKCSVRLMSDIAGFDIVAVRPDGIPGLTAKTERISSREWEVKLGLDMKEFARMAKPNSVFSKVIRIETNLPDEEPVALPVLAVFDGGASRPVRLSTD